MFPRTSNTPLVQYYLTIRPKGEDFSMFQTIRNQNWPWQPCFYLDQDEIRNLCRVSQTSCLLQIQCSSFI